VVTPSVHARIMREVIVPTVAGMAAEGRRFVGFLYAGVMIDKTGVPRVLEFNCRMGDPETQPIMMRIKSDLAQVFELAVAGRLDEATIEWDRRTALGVVMAAKDYPATPRTGDIISRLPENTDECMVFHAGTTLQDGVLKTSGGRVLCVTVLADSVKRAQAAAYAAISKTHFDGQQYRTDIGWRALPGGSSST
jgi:phosphoribosylamine--glycine ligase